MKKNIITKYIILFVSAILCFCVAVFFAESPFVSAIDIEYSAEPLKEYYALGETFITPEAQINADGNILPVVKQALYYPDGNAFSDSQYVLSNPGEYRLRYFADYNGKTVYADDYFSVKGEAYGVSGTTSSVAYGNTGEEKGNINGLVVTLSSGDVFTYKKPLDLNGKKKNDTIVTFYVIPERQGVADVKNVKIRLTDCADESNYVEAVVFANHNDENEFKGLALYSGVRASVHNGYVGAHYKGYNQSGVVYDGNYYSIYKDISYSSDAGYPSFAASLAASKGYGDVGETRFSKPFSFSVDYTEKKFYGYSHGDGEGWLSNNLIADLDDSLFFDTPWDGFTTGEVYLSIYSDFYANSSFTFVVLNIYDEDLTDAKYQYDKAPDIIVDIPAGNVPYAIKNIPYELMDVKAYAGCDGAIDCDVLVYKDYYSNVPKLCPVVDGTFTPTDKNSVYSIVYRATDSYGNSAEKIIDISVKEKREATLWLTDGDEDCFTGKPIILKQPHFEKTNGSAELIVSAICSDETLTIPVSEDGFYRFYTLRSGNYEIKYTLTDYNGPIEISYSLEIKDNPNTVYYGEAILPCAFVNGATYKFPTQYGKAFINGEVRDLTATLKYSFDDGEKRTYDNGEVRIEATNNVKLIYSLEGASEEKIYEIPVTDVGLSEKKYYKEKYFYTKQFDGVSTESGIYYSTAESVAELSYVKPVLVADFGFEYELLSDNFNRIIFTFNDTVDSSNRLKIVITKKNREKLLVSVNDGDNREITSSVLGKTHAIEYNSILNSLKIDGFDFSVKDIKDFAQKNAYFGITVEGNKDVFKFIVKKLNKQIMNTQTSDYAPPLYYLDITDGKKTKGDKIVINGYFIEDVLRFTKSGTITVTDPEGNICQATNGVSMNKVVDFTRSYEISVDSYGEYVISCEYSDGANRQKTTVIVNSYDFTPPTVVVSDAEKYSAVYAGSSYKIASASATDNLGEKIEVTKIVIDTEGKTFIVADEFLFKRAGIYKVVYYAEDSFGNIGFASYDIVAVDKEKK